MLLVNLLPWRKQRIRRRACRWLLLLLLQLIVVSAALGCFYGAWHQQRLLLQHELNDLSAHQRRLTRQYQQTHQMWRQQREYQAQRDADAAALRHNQRYLNLLERMASMMPQRLWLSELIDRGDHLLISGQSENYVDIVALNRSLARHPDLARSRVRQALRQQNAQSLLRFSLQADWAFSRATKDDQADD
ncbi:PilN domain-containing protein [Brenneria sp. 4F2]|nr:PilN domain-containing protein [Brenneria bubanii]